MAEHSEPRPKARDLNQLIRYTMWSVFRVSDRAALDLAGPGEPRRRGSPSCSSRPQARTS